tara:strand:- start:3690 stop:3848 length:159 start_codon:yes stop_codon:yes gene_type:complete
MEEKKEKNVKIFVKGVTAQGEIKEQRSGETADGQPINAGATTKRNSDKARTD